MTRVVVFLRVSFQLIISLRSGRPEFLPLVYELVPVYGTCLVQSLVPVLSAQQYVEPGPYGAWEACVPLATQSSMLSWPSMHPETCTVSRNSPSKGHLSAPSPLIKQAATHKEVSKYALSPNY